jgi:hypothetical protein
MAVMDATNRLRTWAPAMRDWPRSIGMPGVTKPELRAALNATDDWIEANQGSFNAALPIPFRTTATVPQKVFLFCYVAMRRAGRLKAQED